MILRNDFKRILCAAVVPGMMVGAMLTLIPAASAQDGWVSPSPELSGFWEPKFVGQGSGAFGEVFGKVEKAQLKSGAAAPQRRGAADYSYGAKPPVDGSACRVLAFPFYQTSSPPWEIVQTKDEIVILGEREMSSRHVYMDGRGHPAHVPPSSNGDSIGHWDGKTLVVDTVSFRPGMNVPGGGTRGPNSHLIERYTVVDDPKNGQKVEVSFKWDDPTIYEKPHEYTLTYYKMPNDTYALEDWCDAGDPLEYKSAEGIVVIGKDSIYATPKGQEYQRQPQQRGGSTPSQPGTGATPKQ